MSEITETTRTGILTAYDGIFLAGEAKGKAEGKAEGVRNSLLRYLKKHFVLPDDIAEKIEGISDIDLLNELIDAAFDASSLDDVTKVLQ